ncbi:D-Ala-D-Ala carboxypeptidase. Metallo peptidase. MEROPS family M15B [Arthrobacter sp. 49Tsu3.1M3]|jgi:D-alanyl-D-alanine carboxypeptidase|uniref:M15 family metallopeptidase n=1 Tax=Arthrobacter sp. 49Tsu3.1M3 TaxID=1279029 RepID=UPI0009D529E2|nr:M15 family metallopeptidase [Arthrobacter sp. 49Tsu3.1M3]SKB46065.1 D-Ala-D-Ala carboxypeptidase. Metallo peptidase. MEROPS family M15B [Arthrobacter sp. 49Tsu3.1M3]
MCYDDADGTAGRQEAGPESPSRRAFSRLLLAGTGLAALSACTPAQSFTPSGTPGPTPGTGTGSSTPTAAAAASTPPASTPSAPVPESTPAATQTATPVPPSAAARPPSAAAPGPQHSLSDPTSPWVIVNKHRPLSPATFVPPDLARPAVRLATSGEAALVNSTTAAAAERMFAAAAADGVIITLASGYRSFATQRATYGSYVNSRGQAEADTASARPGYSEHQTGWAFDIGDGSGADAFTPQFKDRPAAIWAKANAHRFGFVVRYPWMLHEITGYFYEPWHLRFIGKEAAADMRARGIGTLEQYFGLEAAPAYR